MRMRFMMIVSALIAVLLVSSGLALGSDDAKWTYSVKKGVEKFKRAYLLVSEPDTKDEKHIYVVSTCEKPLHSEGSYGSCIHQINNETDKKKFTLKTGEDVIMVRILRDAPLLLATVEYGCCAGPNVIRFYTENGKYLGAKNEYFNYPDRISRNNVITSKSDFGFGTFDSGKSYLLVEQTAERYSDLKAIVWAAGKLIGTIPVELSIANKEACTDWGVESLAEYGAHDELILTLKGFECDVGELKFNCTATAEKLICLPTNKDTK